MAAEYPAGSIDAYILGRLAMWAGCYQFAETSFREQMAVQPTYRRRQNIRNAAKARVADPEGMIRHAAAGYVKGLERAKWRYLREHAEVDRAAAFREPEPIETEDLMGTVWRVGATAFELRAFLRNLSREEQFYENADRVARKYGWNDNQAANSPSADASGVRPRSRDRSWVQRGEPYVTVHVGALTLVTALGVWCDVPGDGEQIRALFERLLKELSGRTRPG